MPAFCATRGDTPAQTAPVPELSRDERALTRRCRLVERRDGKDMAANRLRVSEELLSPRGQLGGLHGRGKTRAFIDD